MRRVRIFFYFCNLSGFEACGTAIGGGSQWLASLNGRCYSFNIQSLTVCSVCGLQVVLPQLCFDDEDAELWEDDPQEFVRKVRATVWQKK